MGKLFEELKRRKVFRVAAVYAVVAWVLIQVADTVLPALQMPEWTVSFVTVLFILGFPIAVILAWAYEVTPEGIEPDFAAQPVSPTTTSNTDRKLIYAIFALVLLVAGIQLSDRFLPDNSISTINSAGSALVTANPSVMRSSIILNQTLGERRGGLRTALSLAPDGSVLAISDYVFGRLWSRNLATRETQVVMESGSTIHEFSPNSQKLLVFGQRDGAVDVMPTEGGAPQRLPIQSRFSANWLSDDVIIYPHLDGEIRMFSLLDQTDEVIPGLNIDTLRINELLGQLPGRDAFLFSQNQSEIRAYDLKSQSTSLVTNDGYYPQYVSSGHILFLRAGDLWAVPFNIDTLETTGVEARVLEGVDSQPQFFGGIGAFSVSSSGRLVYLPGPEYSTNQSNLVWADRLGNRTELSIRAGNYAEPRLSPNGELLALTSLQPDGSSDVWIHNFSNESFNPVTLLGNARSPVWTPDGSQLVYQLTTENSEAGAPRGELWVMNANGTGQAERILDVPAKADSFSPIDEKLFYVIGGSGGEPINVSTLTHSDDAWISEPLFHTERNTYGTRVSPDGRWIAYGSAEFGSMQIYVQPYPNLDGGRWPVSSNEIGSREPSWGPNGDELFFLSLDGTLMRSEVTIEGDNFSSGVPQPLFADVLVSGPSPLYVVSNDGERFLHFSGIDSSDLGLDQDHAELIVVENFFEELKQLAPPDPQ